MSLVKLDKMDQQKARHKKNHPAEKGHGVGTIVGNVGAVFLPRKKYSYDAAQFLVLKGQI